MEIIMCRGDAEPIGFTIRNCDGEPIDFQPDNIYFTVKRYADEHDPLFQKQLGNGSIQYEGEGAYQFVIEPSDTNELKFGKYAFDIEIVSASRNIKKTFTGALILAPEVTHSYNEGA